MRSVGHGLKAPDAATLLKLRKFKSGQYLDERESGKLMYSTLNSRMEEKQEIHFYSIHKRICLFVKFQARDSMTASKTSPVNESMKVTNSHAFLPVCLPPHTYGVYETLMVRKGHTLRTRVI